MWKQLIAGASLFGVSLGATYFTLSSVNGNSSSSLNSSTTSWSPKDPVKETAGERLLSSLLSYEAMKIDGDIKITLDNRDQITLNLDGQGSIADIADIKLLANLDLNLAGIPLHGEFSYFKDTMTFSVDEICNFKLKTNDLLDFINMIPNYGVAIELPDALGTLDTTTLLTKITSLEEEDVRTLPTGERFYTVSLGENEEAVAIDVLADTENNIKGIKIDHLEYQNTELALRINLNEIKGDELNITNPLEGNDKDKYQDFKPVFTLIDNFYNLINQNQFGLKFTADLANNGKKIVDAEVDVNVDKQTNKFGLDVSLFGDTKEDGSKDKYTLNTAYVDGTIYAKYHNLALSIETLTIANLIDYALEQVKDQFSSKLSETLENGLDLGDFDINGLFTKIKNTLKKVNVSDGSFEIVLNINDFNEYIESETPVLPEDNIVITVNFDDHKVTSINISTLNISTFTINLGVEFTDYTEVNVLDPESYTKIEASDVLIKSILDFVKQKSYYIGFDIATDDNDSTTDDLTMNGYVQLDFTGDNHYGYGNATIVDNNKYHHNLKADMYNEGNFIFSYNDKLKGKFTSQTIFDIAEVVTDLINNPSEHFYELFGELLEKLNSGTISRIIAGEYTLALEYEIISNLEIDDTKTSFDLNLAIFGMDDMTLHMDIGYTYDNVNWESADLDYINISNLKLGDKEVTVNVDFKKYQTNLDETRLNQFDTYMDFSTIKTLLVLGLNTSKFNYYHFTGKLDLSLPVPNFLLKLFGGNITDIGLDAKIKNDHGDVTVAISLTDIPIISGTLFNLNGVDGYKSTDSRNAYIYYKHYEDSEKTDYWYINRQDVVTEKGEAVSGLIFKKYRYYEYDYQVSRKCTNEYFLDNIVDILIKDILGISNQDILDKINESSESDSSAIKYEEILSSYNYSESKHEFDIGIDMKALTGMSLFNDLAVTITEDPSEHILDGVKVHFSMLASLIKADFNLNFEEDRYVDVSNIFVTSADNYIANHINDVADTSSSVTRTVVNTYVK